MARNKVAAAPPRYVDRNGAPIAIGSMVELSHCVGRYGSMAVESGEVVSFDDVYRGVVLRLARTAGRRDGRRGLMVRKKTNLGTFQVSSRIGRTVDGQRQVFRLTGNITLHIDLQALADDLRAAMTNKSAGAMLAHGAILAVASNVKETQIMQDEDI